MLRPASTAEVATAVRLCHDAGVAVVPQGGNTGLCGGAVPDGTGDQVVLSLGRMRRVRALDTDADTITVEAGVVLADLQRAAADAGRLFPLSLGAEGSCTIGGNLATNAGGTAVLRYGMMRDLTLGLEVVLPDGRVWDGLRGLRKDNTGLRPDAAVRRRRGHARRDHGGRAEAVPRDAPARHGLGRAAGRRRRGRGCCRCCRARAGESLTAYELVSRQALDLVLAHVPAARDPLTEAHPWYGLVELAGTAVGRPRDPAVGRAVRGVRAGPARGRRGRGQPRPARGAVDAARGDLGGAEPRGARASSTTSPCPIGSLPAFVSATGRALEAVVPGVRLVTYGHVGDGNLHHNLSKPVGMPDDDFRALAPALARTIYDEVAALGGSISAEHGIGVAKLDAMARYADPVELDLMRSVKRALDPRGLMNPGKLLA